MVCVSITQRLFVRINWSAELRVPFNIESQWCVSQLLRGYLSELTEVPN